MNFIASPTKNCRMTYDEHTAHQIKKSYIQLNRNEEIVYRQLWSFADSENQDKIQGLSAATFLKKSGLNDSVLHEIWRLSDTNNKGYLCFQDFCVCCRLISHVQSGSNATVEYIFQEPRVLPSFDLSENNTDITRNNSLSIPTHLPSKFSNSQTFILGLKVSKETSDSHSNKQSMKLKSHHPTNVTVDSDLALYAICEKEILKYQKIFSSLKLDSTCHLPGEEAKNIMTRSSLPNHTLLKIWDLVDRDQNGKLSEKEFIVAMHLISLARNNIPVPHDIPKELLFLLKKDDDDVDVELRKDHSSKSLKTYFSNNKEGEAFSYLSWNNKEEKQLEEETKHAQDVDQEKNDTTHVPQLFQSIDTKDQEMIRYIVQCLDTFGEELKNFKDIEKTLRWKLVVETKSLKEHLTHRLRFQNNAEILKKELYDVLEQLHQVELQMVITKKDINHYQNDILFLKNIINLIQKDLKNLRSTQQIKKNKLEHSQKHNILLEEKYTNVTQLVLKEEKVLENQNIEIQQLLQKFRLLKEEKQQTSCYDNILQEKCNQAEKKTIKLYQAIQEKQLNLDHIRMRQLQNAHHKLNISNYSERLHLQPHTTKVQSETAQLSRDHKGVPVNTFLPINPTEIKKLNHNLVSPVCEQPCLNTFDDVLKDTIEKKISTQSKEIDYASLHNWLKDDLTFPYQQCFIPFDDTARHNSIQLVVNKEQKFPLEDSENFFPLQSKVLHPVSNPSPTCMASPPKNRITSKLGVQIDNEVAG